jgi:hypothetical protein
VGFNVVFCSVSVIVVCVSFSFNCFVITLFIRFAPSRSSAAQTLAHSLISKSVNRSGSDDESSVVDATQRRPRVIFDAFNLEEASDDVAKGRDHSGGVYDAGKKPLKVTIST